MKIKSPSHFRSWLFDRYPGIVYGCTTRKMGDMRNPLARKSILSKLSKTRKLILPRQTHGTSVAVVSDRQTKTHITADALVYKVNKIQAPMLGVLTADCVPVLLYSTTSNIVAVIHAGWRGVLGNIIKNTVTVMRRMGSKAEDILVTLGPHIKSCCYNIEINRANAFVKLYGTSAVLQHYNSWYLRLDTILVTQLKYQNIPEKHIDSDSSVCTSCHIDQYFSYRKDSQSTFGEMLSYISVCNPYEH